MGTIITLLRQELKQNIDPHTKTTGQDFFREKVIIHGVKTALVTKIAKAYDKEVLALDKKEAFALCHILCNHTIGTFVEMYPKYLENLKKWAESNNRWMRRASAVSLIIPARHGKFLPDIFKIADILLLDGDDLVQKGYGWMLKAASEAHQKEVFEYVMKNNEKMPRTALRYAIKKMPKGLKIKAMTK